jgi:hypothetical protein
LSSCAVRSAFFVVGLTPRPSLVPAAACFVRFFSFPPRHRFAARASSPPPGRSRAPVAPSVAADRSLLVLLHRAAAAAAAREAVHDERRNDRDFSERTVVDQLDEAKGSVLFFETIARRVFLQSQY